MAVTLALKAALDKAGPPDPILIRQAWLTLDTHWLRATLCVQSRAAEMVNKKSKPKKSKQEKSKNKSTTKYN